MRRRKIAAGFLAAWMMICGTAFADSPYMLQPESAPRMLEMLQLMRDAARKRTEGDEASVYAAAEAIRPLSGSDYEIARTMADEWFGVYLNPDYPIRRHIVGDLKATALEEAGLDPEIPRAIAVLGYRLNEGEMTRELRGRCKAAAAAARSFPDALVICSGGATGSNNPERHTEAGLMKKYLTRTCGIEAERILTDEEARTTLDNALNAYRLLQERDLHEVILVTSTYHLKWAHAIFGAAAELFRQESGYRIHVADNYCFQIENNGRYQTDTMTIAQLRELVNQITPPPEENENR